MPRLTSYAWLDALTQQVAKYGISQQALFQHAQVALPDTGGQAVTMGFEQDDITRLWQAAGMLSQDPALGLKAGASLPPSTFAALSYGLMSSPTLGDSLALLVAYQHLLADALDFALLQHKEQKQWQLVINNLGDQLPASHLAIDAAMAALVHFYQWLRRSPLPLVAVHFSRRAVKRAATKGATKGPKPSSPSQHHLSLPPADYSDFFACKCRFQQNSNSLWFSDAVVQEALPTANAELAALHSSHLQQLSKAQQQGQLSLTVCQIIRQLLTQGQCSIHAVAQRMHTSVSGLQRQLAQENHVYQTLLDRTREQIAIAQLRHSNISITGLAADLGFANAASFSRSFKKWTGHTPKFYRNSTT